MVSQVLESTVDQLRTFSHLVTLVKPSTGHEISLTVRTFAGGYAELMAAVNAERKAQKLSGYRYFESLPC